MLTSQGYLGAMEEIRRVHSSTPWHERGWLNRVYFIGYAIGWASVIQAALRHLFGILRHSVPEFYLPRGDILSLCCILHSYWVVSGEVARELLLARNHIKTIKVPSFVEKTQYCSTNVFVAL